jgi:hypothetical protein
MCEIPMNNKQNTNQVIYIICTYERKWWTMVLKWEARQVMDYHSSHASVILSRLFI